jgi:hypothetical protein
MVYAEEHNTSEKSLPACMFGAADLVRGIGGFFRLFEASRRKTAFARDADGC